MSNQIVPIVEMCMDIVSLDNEVDTSPLSQSKWSNSQVRTQPLGSGSYDVVHYFKDDLILTLLDYSIGVECRLTAPISPDRQFSELRALLIDELDAVPLPETNGLQVYSDRIAAGSPQTALSNMLIASDYNVYVEEKTLALDETRRVTVAIVSTSALPPEFQSRQQAATE